MLTIHINIIVHVLMDLIKYSRDPKIMCKEPNEVAQTQRARNFDSSYTTLY